MTEEEYYEGEEEYEEENELELDNGEEPDSEFDVVEPKLEKDYSEMNDGEKEDFVVAQEKKVDELFARVTGMKYLLENQYFHDSFIRPINENIKRIKTDLETMEKSRLIAVAQGALIAYKDMRDQAKNVVDEFSEKIEKLKRDYSMFFRDNDFIQNVRVEYDKEIGKIIIKGIE